ncbi:ankyrin repeats (many copies) domain-containing protein [Ditylenchus destructor]|nr:ankyrin repeats (many copies) domain-containing protein [Ditylenchus destructor]
MAEATEPESLHTAAEQGLSDVVTELIRQGANVHTKDATGATPLHYAAEHGHLDTIRALILEGADVNERSGNSRGRFYAGGTPLHYAAINGKTEACRILLDSGATVNAKTSSCLTPLTLADHFLNLKKRRTDHWKTAQLLKHRGGIKSLDV